MLTNTKLLQETLKLIESGQSPLARVNGAFGEGVGPIFLNQLNCDGSELDLLECDRQSFLGLVDCTHARDAGVVCPGKFNRLDKLDI